MFGYIRVDENELLVRELNAYKAVYCGLCKQLGKDYSVFARLALSYDCTFYAILLMSLERSCNGFTDKKCTCNPLKKCKFAMCNSECYNKASALTVISVYYKIKDNIADSKFFKKAFYKMIMPIFSHWRKKAALKYPELDKIVAKMLEMQFEDEKSSLSSVDSAAHPTAFMLGSILALEAKNDIEKRVLYEFGYHIGRWIYLIDAVDDISEDRKNQNFNPYIKNNISNDKIQSILNQSLARAYDAYILMDIVDFKGILDNVILKGLPNEQNKIISKLIKEETNG
ncbi:MAG: DUF5685 family protein [Ruminococcus sp.]|nr:DUF5685 family protein [Ruminococcus sp.]